MFQVTMVSVVMTTMVVVLVVMVVMVAMAMMTMGSDILAVGVSVDMAVITIMIILAQGNIFI